MLAHIFEAEGIATIALGSVRKQIESTAPPRGLLCNFPLGRPLGKPGDAEFQHRVIARAFSLLEATEPILVEYEESIEEESSEGLACPLPARSNADLHVAIDEFRGLRQAYDRAIAQYGNRAGTGRSIGVNEIEGALESLIRVAEGTPWKEAGIPGPPNRVAQDIRGYYEIAALGLSDHIPAAWASTNWFLDETQGGKLLLAARSAIRDAGENRPVWFYMTPGDR